MCNEIRMGEQATILGNRVRSLHPRSYVIAMTLSCLVLSYGWIRVVLLGCNMIPRPRSSSLQDAEVNNEFIRRPFERLSQRTLPSPWPPLSLSFFFFGSDSGGFQGPYLIPDETMLLHPLPWLLLCTLLWTHRSFDCPVPQTVWQILIFIPFSIQARGAGNKEYPYLLSSWILKHPRFSLFSPSSIVSVCDL